MVKLLEPGHFIMGFGPRGSGKTSKAMHVGQTALDRGWVVFSNVLIGAKKGDVLVRGTMKDYNHVRYLGNDIFRKLPDILDAKRNSLVIIDESMTATGFGSGQTVLNAEVRAVLGWVSLLRKFRMCLYVIGLDETTSMSKYRAPGPVVTFVMRAARMAGYDPREIAEIQGAHGKRKFKYTPKGIARPLSAVEDGEIVFETLAPGGFELGTAGGKKFNPTSFFNEVSDSLPAEMPERIRSYFERPEPMPATSAEFTQGASKPRSRAPGPLGLSTQHGVKAEVVRLLNEGQAVRDIVEATGASKQYIYRVRQKLSQPNV